MTPQERKVIELALDALESMQNAIYNISGEHIEALSYAVKKANVAEQTITTIKEALAQPEQEPVADVLIDHEDEDGHAVLWLRDYALENGQHLLYTTPPQPTQVKLTDDEIWKFWCLRPEIPEGENDSMEAEFVAAVRRVLAAHGIKE